MCPKLWPVKTCYLRNLTLALAKSAAKGGSDPLPGTKGGSDPLASTKQKPTTNVYCSVAFEHVIYYGPANMAKGPTDPVVRLHQWVLEWLPGYGQTWSQLNKTPNKLLVSHSYVLDRIFIEQLWLYSKLAGPDKFPCGLFKHPFDDGWKKAVYEASGLSLPDGHFSVGGSSSSGSGGPVAPGTLAGGPASADGLASSSASKGGSDPLVAPTASTPKVSKGGSDPLVAPAGSTPKVSKGGSDPLVAPTAITAKASEGGGAPSVAPTPKPKASKGGSSASKKSALVDALTGPCP